MTKVEIKEATGSDAWHIANNLRAADWLELTAAGAISPDHEVMESWQVSTMCYVVKVDDLPTLIYGVAQGSIEGEGIPWMVATDDILKISAKFIRGCKHEVDKMQARYPVLSNIVHKDNHVSINWLKWLGFVIDPTPFFLNPNFYEFSRG